MPIIRRPSSPLLIGLILLTGLFFGPKAALGQSLPKMGAPNRARHADYRASSFRRARIEEIPRATAMRASAGLANPLGWPRWTPAYAIDGSPLTKWSSEPSGDTHWIELRFNNRLAGDVPVSALAISWGDNYGKRYRIMGGDGRYWKQAALIGDGGGGVEPLRFDPPVRLSALRIEVPESKGSGVDIVDIGVYGPPGEAAPEKPAGFIGEALGEKSLRLRWKKPAGDGAYLYKLYRSTRPDPPLGETTFVETVFDNDYVDHGLEPGRTYHYRLVAESFGGARSEAAAAICSTSDGVRFARFKYRGVVEGFYNDPWPHQDRLAMLSFMEDAGYNYYIYAPKIDPFHRQRWWNDYPEAENENFAELASYARAHGIVFNYGISPGLDMDLGSEKDRTALKDKLGKMHALGVRSFTLLMDDIPRSRSADGALARAQAGLANEVLAYLKTLDSTAELFFVPTVYSRTYSHHKGRRPSRAQYLEGLAALDPAVGIMWTGPGEVFSAEVGPDGAAELKKLWGRPVLVWDNYPVNDMSLRDNIFTGPYMGRPAELSQSVNGIFLNPMYLPHASKVALFTAGEYMTSPSYDPWEAYDNALDFLGQSAAGKRALKTVSDCLLPHPVFPELGVDQVPVNRAIERYWSSRSDAESFARAEARLRQQFELLAKSDEELGKYVPDKGLVRELSPPAEKLALYGKAGLLCLDIMRERDPERNVALRREILELQARARLNGWRVVDERTNLPAAYLGVRVGNRNALDDFVTRVLAELPR